MSKAFYKSSVAPTLLHRWSHSRNNIRRAVELWTTTCIVTNFGKNVQPDSCSVLVNPSNPQLSGVRNFPYFPRGGPVPKERPMSMHKDWQPLGYVSQWGGMEVGNGMLFPVSVVDGLVHQTGGWPLEAACRWKQRMASSFRNTDACPPGKAVLTTCGGPLQQRYDWIVHTTPPFYKNPNENENNHNNDNDSSCEDILGLCYRKAFTCAFERTRRVAIPLLGAGARGFPDSIAIHVAARACVEWCLEGEDDMTGEQVVAFGLLERRLANELYVALENHDCGST